MMPFEEVRLSNELIAWARQAGYGCTPSPLKDGECVLWSDPGGETQFYLEAKAGWISLSRSDRSAPASFILAAKSLAVLERYLFDAFGADVRNANGLPWLRVPTKAEEVATGFNIAEHRDGFTELVLSNDAAVARCRPGRLGTMILVVISHLYDAPIPEIERTYLNPDGGPLFPQSVG